MNDNNTAHISSLKASDLYRIGPNIPQTLCHNRKVK